MNKDKTIGICTASLLFSILCALTYVEFDLLCDLPYIAVSIIALVIAINVYKEKRWAYWCALGLSGIQMIGFIIDLINLPEIFFWEELSPIFVIITSMQLLKKKVEPGT